MDYLGMLLKILSNNYVPFYIVCFFTSILDAGNTSYIYGRY